MISSTPTLFEALATVPVLTGLNLVALAMLANEGMIHDYEQGAVIVREGDKGHSLFILVEGDVDVIKYFDTAHAVTLATLKSRTFFGEMCVVDPVPRAATVKAITPVKAIEIKAGTLHHLFKEMPDQYSIVLLNLARDLARRLRTLDEAFAAKS